MATFVLRREMRGRSERIIGFELDHRPDDNAHRRKRLLERMELREQRGLDAGAGLVVRPKPIAKRLDHVIGGDAEVRVAVLDHSIAKRLNHVVGGDAKVNGVALQHLENRLQYANDRAVRTIFAFGKPAQPVKVAKQFVGTVNKIDDHNPLG